MASEDDIPLLVGQSDTWMVLLSCSLEQRSDVHRLSLTGHNRMVKRTDGEPPIQASRTQVADVLATFHGVKVVLEEVVVGDSEGNGLAEPDTPDEGGDQGAEEAGQKSCIRWSSRLVGGVCVFACQHWSQGVGLRASRGKAALSSSELVECSENQIASHWRQGEGAL